MGTCGSKKTFPQTGIEPKKRNMTINLKNATVAQQSIMNMISVETPSRTPPSKKVDEKLKPTKSKSFEFSPGPDHDANKHGDYVARVLSKRKRMKDLNPTRCVEGGSAHRKSKKKIMAKAKNNHSCREMIRRISARIMDLPDQEVKNHIRGFSVFAQRGGGLTNVPEDFFTSTPTMPTQAKMKMIRSSTAANALGMEKVQEHRTSEITKILATHYLFSSLSDSEINKISWATMVVDVKVGTVLLRQDHGEEKLASAAEDKTVGTDDDKSINYWETPYFWGILEGEVEICREGKTAKTLSPGQSFGELALLYHSVPRITATAHTDCTLFSLSPTVYKGLMHSSAKSKAKTILECLAQVKQLKSLTSDQLQSIAQLVERVQVPVGEVLYTRGDTLLEEQGDYFYMVEDGQVTLTHPKPLKPQVISTTGHFGHEALGLDDLHTISHRQKASHRESKKRNTTAVASKGNDDMVKLLRLHLSDVDAKMGSLREVVRCNLITDRLSNISFLRHLPKAHLQSMANNMHVFDIGGEHPLQPALQEEYHKDGSHCKVGDYLLMVVEGALAWTNPKWKHCMSHCIMSENFEPMDKGPGVLLGPGSLVGCLSCLPTSPRAAASKEQFSQHPIAAASADQIQSLLTAVLKNRMAAKKAGREEAKEDVPFPELDPFEASEGGLSTCLSASDLLMGNVDPLSVFEENGGAVVLALHSHWFVVEPDSLAAKRKHLSRSPSAVAMRVASQLSIDNNSPGLDPHARSQSLVSRFKAKSRRRRKSEKKSKRVRRETHRHHKKHHRKHRKSHVVHGGASGSAGSHSVEHHKAEEGATSQPVDGAKHKKAESQKPGLTITENAGSAKADTERASPPIEAKSTRAERRKKRKTKRQTRKSGRDSAAEEASGGAGGGDGVEFHWRRDRPDIKVKDYSSSSPSPSGSVGTSNADSPGGVKLSRAERRKKRKTKRKAGTPLRVSLLSSSKGSDASDGARAAGSDGKSTKHHKGLRLETIASVGTKGSQVEDAGDGARAAGSDGKTTKHHKKLKVRTAASVESTTMVGSPGFSDSSTDSPFQISRVEAAGDSTKRLQVRKSASIASPGSGRVSRAGDSTDAKRHGRLQVRKSASIASPSSSQVSLAGDSTDTKRHERLKLRKSSSIASPSSSQVSLAGDSTDTKRHERLKLRKSSSIGSPGFNDAGKDSLAKTPQRKGNWAAAAAPEPGSSTQRAPSPKKNTKELAADRVEPVKHAEGAKGWAGARDKNVSSDGKRVRDSTISSLAQNTKGTDKPNLESAAAKQRSPDALKKQDAELDVIDSTNSSDKSKGSAAATVHTDKKKSLDGVAQVLFEGSNDKKDATAAAIAQPTAVDGDAADVNTKNNEPKKITSKQPADQDKGGKAIGMVTPIKAKKNKHKGTSLPVNADGGLDCTLQDLENVCMVGQGAFGAVFMTKMRESDKEEEEEHYFALKKMSKNQIIKASNPDAVLRETQILRLTRGSIFIPYLFAALQDDNHLYLLTEFIQGGDLYFLMKNSGMFEYSILPISLAKTYSACLVCALTFLQEQGVVFRDLKPENIMLTASGHIKLVDYGIAKQIANKDSSEMDKRTFTIVGTPEYIAPEALLGSGYGFSVDVWSLSIVLFEMLCGFTPFADSEDVDEGAIYERILHEDMEIHVECVEGDDAIDLMTQLFERDVHKRIGCSLDGMLAFKTHPFFEDIEWAKIITGDYSAPLVPVVRNKKDLSNFSTRGLKEMRANDKFKRTGAAFEDSWDECFIQC